MNSPEINPASAAAEIAEYGGDPEFMASLARGIAVIRAFAPSSPRMTVQQISQRTGIPRTAVRRCLYTLECLQYVGSDGPYYWLRPRVLSLGHMYLSSIPLAVTAQPIMDQITHDLHETCSLAVLDDENVVIIAHASRTPLLGVAVTIGTRLPAYCTASGRVLLSELSEAEQAARVANFDLESRTEKTIASRADFLKMLRKTKEMGYSLVDQELDAGLRAIAVPVRDVRQQVIAALTIAVPTGRARAAALKGQFLARLLEAAAQMS